ncbi:MAG: hypothetical protein K2X27_13490 [Candidatus Obscuribacterales bacterium]|nr:hypothetical protein [Candidatus Obscuribacterales bacterium]
MADNLQYRWYSYFDDDAKIWAVYLRKRNGQVGNFADLTLDEYSRNKAPINAWAFPNLAMRHVTIRLDNGKYIKVPVQKPNVAPYNAVGSRVTVPIWDTGIDDGGPASATMDGTVIGRVGERIRGDALLDVDDGIPT